MKHARRMGLALMMVIPALWSVHGADDAKGIPITEAEYRKLVKSTVDEITKTLAKTDAKSKQKARMAAIFLAAYAQHTTGGPGAAERATMRDAALKLAQTIAAGQIADAKKQASALLTLKADPNANTAPLSIMKVAKLKVDDLMHQFGPPARGGYGIEFRYKKLTGLGNKLPNETLDDEFLSSAYRVAMSFAILKNYKHEDDPDKFRKYVDDAYQATVDMIPEVRAQNGPRTAPLLYKLTIVCSRCHNDFR
ncbi:MAG: hypothetical protein KatS3mg105_0499 [Gemmatales bacterium]|nr:MAG: hypothetical protein KatS3mg105_0499 [Gemmatales bacterium]